MSSINCVNKEKPQQWGYYVIINIEVESSTLWTRAS